MKTEPTEIDRESAELFTAAPGMRLLTDDGDALRVVVNKIGELWTCCECCEFPDTMPLGEGPPYSFAFDTDDGPTHGAMLEQVEAAAGADCDVTHGTTVDPAGELKWKVRKANGFDLHVLGNVFGPTRGAALVAAKRALKAKP